MKKRFLLTLCFISISSLLFAQAEDVSKSSNTMLQDISTSSLGISATVAMSDPAYLVTPGDVYRLTYSTNNGGVDSSIPVDASYKIRIGNMAVIDAAGKTYVELKKLVEEVVTRNYPLSGAQFLLSTPSTFKITITGEVTGTKETTAWALNRVSSFVNAYATAYTSVRNVKVTSANGKSKTYDLFLASRNADLSNDPYVRPGDVITFAHTDRVVTISGAVERPGTYQLLPGENLEKLINYYANGLTTTADPSRIEVSRIITEKSNAGEKIYLGSVMADNAFDLHNADSVNILTYTELRPVMYIEGAVGSLASSTSLNTSAHMPIQFEPETNYAYFVRKNADLFKSSVSDIANAYVMRGNDAISLNIQAILYTSNFDTDLTLQAGDVLVVPFKQYYVTVAGAVRSPGRYPYIPDRTWEYYVGLAGGFNTTENIGKAITMKDFNGKKLKKSDYLTPESTIIAVTNKPAFYINQYAALLSSLSSIVSLIVTYFTMVKNKF